MRERSWYFWNFRLQFENRSSNFRGTAYEKQWDDAKREKFIRIPKWAKRLRYKIVAESWDFCTRLLGIKRVVVGIGIRPEVVIVVRLQNHRLGRRGDVPTLAGFHWTTVCSEVMPMGENVQTRLHWRGEVDLEIAEREYQIEAIQ